MTLEAEKARANAIALEVKKDGLSQRQSGDWSLRFTVAATDMDQRLTSATMGARFQCVLVEIGDDETAVNHNIKDRDKWRDLGPTKQAALRCKDPVFWAFLREQWGKRQIVSEETAADFVRVHCGIGSRSDLDKPGKTNERQRWYALDNAFQAWKAREHV